MKTEGNLGGNYCLEFKERIFLRDSTFFFFIPVVSILLEKENSEARVLMYYLSKVRKYLPYDLWMSSKREFSHSKAKFLFISYLPSY